MALGKPTGLFRICHVGWPLCRRGEITRFSGVAVLVLRKGKVEDKR